MNKYLAIVVYGSEVAGKKGDSLDIQTRFFEASSEEEVVERIEGENPCTYSNDRGEEVAWPLRAIMAVEEFGDLESGEELIGFISSANDIAMLA